MSFGRAQGSVLTDKIVNLAFSRLHLCLGKFQQSSVLLFIPFNYPALGLGEMCRSPGIPPVSTDNRLKGELDELMFIAGSRIRLALSAAAAAAGISHRELWAHLQVELFWRIQHLGPAPVLLLTHTP